MGLDGGGGMGQSGGIAPVRGARGAAYPAARAELHRVLGDVRTLARECRELGVSTARWEPLAGDLKLLVATGDYATALETAAYLRMGLLECTFQHDAHPRVRRKRAFHARRAIVSMILAGLFVMSALTLLAPSVQAPPVPIVELQCRLPADYGVQAIGIWRPWMQDSEAVEVGPLFCRGSEVVTVDANRSLFADSFGLLVWIGNTTGYQAFFASHTLDSDEDFRFSETYAWGEGSVRVEVWAPAPSPVWTP